MQLKRIWPLRPSWYLNWLKCQLNYDWSWSDGSAFLMFFSPHSKASESLRASSHTSVCLTEPFTWGGNRYVVSRSLCRAVIFTVHFLFSDPLTINVGSFILHCKTSLYCCILYEIQNMWFINVYCSPENFTEKPNIFQSNKMGGEKSFTQMGRK